MADVLIVSSAQDSVSMSMAGMIREAAGQEYHESINGRKYFKCSSFSMLEIPELHINANYLDEYKAGMIVFLSMHSSSQGVPSFTTHAEGNWSEKAELGGLPRSLGVSAPLHMLQLLKALKTLNVSGIGVTYEATHHGPLLNTPSLFVELGGSVEVMQKKEYLNVVSKSVEQLINKETDAYFSKVVVGIGSNHYPSKFTALALGRGYAFAHIMPRYYTSEYEMLDQAFMRSATKPESAVIDWKSINSDERGKIINKLNEMGIDYEKV